VRRDSVKLRRQHARQQDCRRHADQESRDGQREALSQYQPENVRAPGAERGAQRQFARTLGH
jgi:hypothetical protein